jgi:hypothetical protein
MAIAGKNDENLIADHPLVRRARRSLHNCAFPWDMWLVR